MNKIVVGNQKMNMSLSDTLKFIEDIKDKVNENVIICPSSIYIPYYQNKNICMGIQDVFYENEGDYTGFISPKQARELGCSYAIVGHSERRKYGYENDGIINKKMKSVTESGMTAILCVGETLEEKISLKTELALRRQIFGSLLGVKDLDKVIIAYEPVWAIGSNLVLNCEDIEKVVHYIKKVVKQYMDYDNIRVIYGGSVHSGNIEEISKISDIEGVLVGSSSCESSEFLKIKEVVLSN